MPETKTSSILQRLPLILAVTAASYGLNLSHAQASTSQDKKPRTTTQAPTQQPALAKRPR